MEISTKMVLLITMYGLPLWLAIRIRINKNKIKKMITENEVTDILGEELPEINNELEKLPDSTNIYKTMECFVGFTKQNIYKGNFKEVKHCFSIAEKMLENGNNAVKNAIENVYVYSLGTVVALSTLKTNELKQLFNGSLRKEYNKQVCASGI
jgi:chaperonin cofactor prefoldin